jgi:hypothetical protein
MTPPGHTRGGWFALFVLLLCGPVAGCSIESTAKEQAITQASLRAGRPGSTWATGEDSIPASEADGGAITDAEEAVGAGEGTIELSLELPDGYELSEVAPLYVSFSSEDSQVVWAEAHPPEWTFETPRFPLKLPLRFATGQTAVRLDIVVYYCQSARKQLCQMSQLQALVPVSVSSHVSSHVIRLDIPIPIPPP